ncbi:hypothetical protein [Sphingomonas segetis]|jgi:hypothetical protein|uniref:hypothetical protein n=1 Tax=Sphingomonas segetis TaxID=1104779 RepID=UPI0012D35BF4|nr:hypothetical protein [Sphingomonas segetis]
MLIPVALALGVRAAVPVPDTTQEPPSEIVVQGTRVGKQQIRDFVKTVIDVPSTGQIARFQAKACPVVMGLPPAQSAAIAERMRRVAAAAKVGVAPAGCTPNVFVIMAADKKAAITELERRFPAYFSGMSDREVRKLEADPGPAAAWQVRTRYSADGEFLEKPIGGFYVVRGTHNPSRLRSSSVPTFLASVVVIDLKAAGGLTVTQLADYAAMRTFAAADPQRILKTGTPTILGVLGQPDGALLPITLTYWDLGLLKALYSTDNAYYAGYQRGDIEHVMREELEHAGTRDRQH